MERNCWCRVIILRKNIHKHAPRTARWVGPQFTFTQCWLGCDCLQDSCVLRTILGLRIRLTHGHDYAHMIIDFDLEFLFDMTMARDCDHLDNYLIDFIMTFQCLIQVIDNDRILC